jgi:geranylgeranyl reductase family protein
MTPCDAVVVGGGPAGSTCARTLVRAGWNVVLLDRATFPRDKVCAGWLTPGVFPLLDLDPAEYRAAGLTLQEISTFRTGVLAASADRHGSPPIETRYPHVVSYAIRRCEFDAFLLRRAGARVLEGTPMTGLRRAGGRWIVNESIEAPVVIGAGGHFCPVARHLQGAPDTSQPVVAKEAEFRVSDQGTDRDRHAPELLFCRDFEGYGWCVRKGDYLNVGLGRRESRDFGQHLKEFIALLEARGTLRSGTSVRWRGHAYFASGVGPRPLVGAGMLIAGDSAGLAYPESGEGIQPAIASGRLAAETLISAGGHYGAEDLQPYAEALGHLHPPARRPAAPIRSASAVVGRALLRSRLFTRRVLLDRWFLRRTQASG